MKDIGSTEFTPEALDQLDYFLACLKQRGIYTAAHQVLEFFQ